MQPSWTIRVHYNAIFVAIYSLIHCILGLDSIDVRVKT